MYCNLGQITYDTEIHTSLKNKIILWNELIGSLFNKLCIIAVIPVECTWCHDFD